MSGREVIDRARYRLRRGLGRSPRLFRLSVIARPHQLSIVVQPDADVVIEGFPRSGNNFAFEAFQLANPGARIASRTHAPAQVRRAVELGLPTVLVVREPSAAVLSMVVRQPYLTVVEALRDWAGYHRHVLGDLDGVVVAPFERVTTDFGSVVEAVNERFGRSFTVFDHTPENERRILRAIERHHRDYFGGRVLETHVARPSAERARLKEEAEQQLEGADATEALAVARAVHAEVLAHDR